VKDPLIGGHHDTILVHCLRLMKMGSSFLLFEDINDGKILQ